MPVELSEPLQKALDANGSPLRVVDPRSRAEYVLIPAALFERWESSNDDTVFTTAEMLDQVMAEDDANDSTLDEWQNY